MALPTGTTIDFTYTILEPLNPEGREDLYEARDLRTGQLVVLRLVPAPLRGESELLERLRSERRVLQTIDSEHLVRVLDIRRDLGYLVIVAEPLQGESLATRLGHCGVVSLSALMPLIEQSLLGLSALHTRGLLHRHLASSSLFLTRRPDGWECVKIRNVGLSSAELSPHPEVDLRLQTLLPFVFQPREQLTGAPDLDATVDLYALGVVVFQALTGRLPFRLTTVTELLVAKQMSDPMTLSQETQQPCPAALEAWVGQCLQRQRDRRFQSADQALVAWRQLRPFTTPYVFRPRHRP